MEKEEDYNEVVPIAGCAYGAPFDMVRDEVITVNVVLKNMGPKPIAVIKILRKNNKDLSLREAKEIVMDRKAAVLYEGCFICTAEAYKIEIEKTGAEVELIPREWSYK